MFFRSLSTMFAAGIPLVACFEYLAEQSDSEEQAELARDLAARIGRGESIHRAFAQYPRVFSVLQINLIKVGVKSGMLEAVFRQIADYEEKRRAVSMKLYSSLTYPVIVFCISLVGLFVLPTFAMGGLFEMLRGSGLELPLLTRLIMVWADLVRSPWLYPGAAAASIAVYYGGTYLWRSHHLREAAYEASFQLPLVSELLRLLTTLRFTRCLHIQLLAGVNILKAIPLACEATGWEPTRRSHEQILDCLKGGSSLSEALARQAIYDSLLIEMVKAGEESGKLAYTLSRTVALYEQEVDYIIEVFVNLLEPLVMAFLGVICAIFVLGVAMPLVQLLQVLS